MAKKISKNNSKIKKLSKKNKKKIHLALIITTIIIVAIAYSFYINNKDTLFKSPLEGTLIVAIVNEEEITLDEINEAYDRLPDEYKMLISKAEILNETIIERLLLQEAEKQDITATEEEVAKIIDEMIKQSKLSEKEFEEKLDSLKISRTYLNEYYMKQLIISRLLNETLFKEMIISDAEIEKFYEKNELALQNITLEDSKKEIKDLLLSEKKKSAYFVYINQLKTKANIEIFLDKPVAGTSGIPKPLNVFEETQDSPCKMDDKPIIRLYSTTNCKSCKWIKETFDSFAKQYQEQNKIMAYHWELNTGDNTLTGEIEKGIPKSELDIFKKYNPKSTIPTFVFSCRYIRTGNAYEHQENLDAEKQEFERIINKLTK